jgi:hypothetical protein
MKGYKVFVATCYYREMFLGNRGSGHKTSHRFNVLFSFVERQTTPRKMSEAPQSLGEDWVYHSLRTLGVLQDVGPDSPCGGMASATSRYCMQNNSRTNTRAVASQAQDTPMRKLGCFWVLKVALFSANVAVAQNDLGIGSMMRSCIDSIGYDGK